MSQKNTCLYEDLLIRWAEFKSTELTSGKTVTGTFIELIVFGSETTDYTLTDKGGEFANNCLNEGYGFTYFPTP